MKKPLKMTFKKNIFLSFKNNKNGYLAEKQPVEIYLMSVCFVNYKKMNYNYLLSQPSYKVTLLKVQQFFFYKSLDTYVTQK